MGDRAIKSPLPGTFYRRSAPDAEPYVSEGDRVEQGDVIGLVEIMKSFHEVKSDESGVLEAFVVENEDVVEAGQDIATLQD
jgi:acetyl-CoA carboxylase biotin carboxyl carrier protein